MSPIIDVEPDVYDAASAVFGNTVVDQLTDAVIGLKGALSDTGGMAGADPGGMDWASAYDEAAKATVGGVTDATYACYKIAAMLQQSGFNHGQAEQASDQTLFTTPADTTTYQAPATLSCDPEPPSAAGGSGDPPKGWGLIEHAVGYVWPNGNPDKLRRAAHAWDAAADRLNTASYEIPEALHAIRSQQSPEVDDAVTVCEAMMGHIQEIASSCRDLSTACIQLADHIEHAHKEVIDELTELLVWTVAIQAGGAALALFSFGASEAAAQAAQAARIAATALRIGTVISKLTAAARAVAAGITKVTVKIAEVVKRLKIFRNAKTGTPTTKDATALTQAASAPGRALRSVDDVLANPQLLSSRTPSEVEAILKGTPGWRIETLGKGGHKGQGWVFRHYNEVGQATGPQLRWHPGGGHHGPEPYWRVVGPNGDLGGIIR